MDSKQYSIMGMCNSLYFLFVIYFISNGLDALHRAIHEDTRGLLTRKPIECNDISQLIVQKSPAKCVLEVNIKNECVLYCQRLWSFPKVLAPMTQVTELFIRDSSIYHLSAESFRVNSTQIFPNLVRFTCDYCEIKDIQEKTFTELKLMKVLAFSWNPFYQQPFENAICDLMKRRYEMKTISMKGRVKTKDTNPLSNKVLHCLRNVTTKTLYLSFDTFNITNIHDLACAVSKSINELMLDYITDYGPLKLDPKTFECFNGSVSDIQVNWLALTNIRFRMFNFDSLQYLQKIQKFYISGTCLKEDLKNLNVFKPMKVLKDLTILCACIRDFSMFSHTPSHVLTNLTSLRIGENNFYKLFPFKEGSMANLEELSICQNRLEISQIPHGFIKKLPKIRTLEFTENSIHNIKEYAFLSTTLRVLNLSRIEVDIFSISHTTFQKAEKLTVLKIDNWNPSVAPTKNYYRHLQTFLRHGFRNLTNLKVLSLVQMKINRIDSKMFHGTNNLRHLDLSRNTISEIGQGALTALTSLGILSLQNNKLEHITKQMLPNTSKNPYDLLLIASYNSWSCDCELLWFRSLLTGHSISERVLIEDKADVLDDTCTFPPKLYGVPLADFKPDYDICIGGLPTLYYLLIDVSGGICVFVLLVSIIYRARWHIYYIYINGNALRKRRRDAEEKEFDAFVAYNRLDTKWVVHELRPVLEDEHELKLCLHDRDWAAGVDIVDNIQSSIERSRKVVLVITNAFAQSDWCQLELTMAQHQLFSKDTDNLILLIKEPVLDCFMTPRLALQMKSQTYIEWPESEMGQKVFWIRLAKAICTSSGSVKHKPTMFQIN